MAGLLVDNLFQRGQFFIDLGLAAVHAEDKNKDDEPNGEIGGGKVSPR